MLADKYIRKHGKLRDRLAIPVDERMRKIAENAKQQGFDFNAWARDVLAERIHEVAQACEQTGPEVA